MKKLIQRFGKLTVSSFIIMGIGVVTFLLTPILYPRYGIDTDLPGALIVDME
jgi:hypothetical protein